MSRSTCIVALTLAPDLYLCSHTLTPSLPAALLSNRASVKNFQLTTERDAKLPRPTVQFGKVQTDLFTLDFVGPISALEAFMLALASCDNKLACG